MAIPTPKSRRPIVGEITQDHVRFLNKLAKVTTARIFEAIEKVGGESEDYFVLAELLLVHSMAKFEGIDSNGKRVDHRLVLQTMADNAANLVDAAVARQDYQPTGANP